MAEDDQTPDEIEDIDPDQYEILTYRRDRQQAEQFQDLLKDHDIEAIVPDDDSDEWNSAEDGFAVLVPTDSVEEAREVLEEIESIEEIDTADPDFEGDVDDDEQLDEELQPLGADPYYLEGDEAAPELDTEEAF